MTDYDWRAVQSRLLALGFDPGPIDGIRGPRTNAAIIAFKRSIGFLPRDYYGPLTHAALMGEPEQPAPGEPDWLTEGRRVMGLHERRDTDKLRGWFADEVDWLDPTEVPWCGAFVATCILRARPAHRLPANPLAARSWATWGRGCDPTLGAVLVFWRGDRNGWQGHVGFGVGQDRTHFHVLGGNQSDAVTVSRIERSRLLAARWTDFDTFGAKMPTVDPLGLPVTWNEA